MKLSGINLHFFARVRSERDREQASEIARGKVKRYGPYALLALGATAWVFSFNSLKAQKLKATLPNLNLILDSMERAEEQNSVHSRPYAVTRQYKVFRGDDPTPSSEVTAQIKFTPPDIKTFIITQQQGNATGQKFVTALLEQEVASAKAGHKGDISRANYDFSFLREENFGVVPEYVLHIIPKRKEKGLLLGDVWVDAKTYEIRQIVGVPLKSPSFWIKDINITLQFGAVDGVWMFTSVDAFARVRFLGLFTLTGRDLTPPSAASTVPGS